MRTLPNPFYYLDNFRTVLDWIASRYDDLLLDAERSFMAGFSQLPKASQALLVRMVMRKGRLFRSGKLAYDEIGCPHAAAEPLLAAGWVSEDAPLGIADLSAVLKKDELAGLLPDARLAAGLRKAELLEVLHALCPDCKPYRAWLPDSEDRMYALAAQIDATCEILKLIFFGNLHQDWTEFVLAELGTFQYEKVELGEQDRGFRTRDDVLAYLHLFRCRERFEAGEPAVQILAELGVEPASEWLRARRARLLFQIGYDLERSGEFAAANGLYRQCGHPEARLRAVRVLEKTGDAQAAYQLAETAWNAPECDAERQHLERILPRLRRKLGLPKLPPVPAVAPTEWELKLAAPEHPLSVEYLVRDAIDQADAPAYYVENTLINALFGLLCWEAVFQPVPGAFFHPFHTGPADLHSAEFRQRREAIFASCFELLQTGEYRETMRRRYREKYGIQSPFVFWGALSEEMLELALMCIPPAHLRCWFERLLQDIKANRNGFPDLVQFWPEEQRYRMIEVKGPGDRLQDNQLRMLGFAHRHGIPVEVCYVSWLDAA